MSFRGSQRLYRYSFVCAAYLIISFHYVLTVAAADVKSGLQDTPRYQIRIVHCWIPMQDGTRLAGNLFMPDGAEAGKRFASVLEYLPYRSEESLATDLQFYSYFVQRGYVMARVDIRGTGQSEGQPPDREYSEEEQSDGVRVIEWLSRQPWSNGSVGMMGVSWGGFNSIQLAARHPAALKAIIAVDATDELFHDDVHYIDGMLHADQYELSMDLSEALTRAPDFPTDSKSLAPRFDNPPWFLLYLRHQRDGPFWRRASLNPNYNRIQIPVFMIGGFLDQYRDSIPRLFAHVRSPVKALVGPWDHAYPNVASPGPQIEWRDEAVRWWDHWLNGKQNGVMEEPHLIVYMRHWYPPLTNIRAIPGEWRSEGGWPPVDLKTEMLYLRRDRSLGGNDPSPAEHDLGYVASAGVEAGFWWGNLVPDQRPVDAYCLTYDSEPIKQPKAILGLPRVLLRASTTARLANWFIRLSDISPDGSATMITGGGLAGAQRESASDPADLEPNRLYTIDVPLHFTSWVFPPGHRMRIAISNSLWPMIWPTPYTMRTTVKLGGSVTDASRLVIPTVPATSHLRPQTFQPPKPEESVPRVRAGHEPRTWMVRRDVLGRLTKVDLKASDWADFPWGREADEEHLTYGVEDDHPERASFVGEASTTVQVPGRTLIWKANVALTSDATHFKYRFTRVLLENGAQRRSKTWYADIPRDHQ